MRLTMVGILGFPWLSIVLGFVVILFLEDIQTFYVEGVDVLWFHGTFAA